jgi:hypothetical protein
MELRDLAMLGSVYLMDDVMQMESHFQTRAEGLRANSAMYSTKLNGYKSHLVNCSLPVSAMKGQQKARARGGFVVVQFSEVTPLLEGVVGETHQEDRRLVAAALGDARTVSLGCPNASKFPH